MDATLKTLLIELAETTLKVLNPESLNPTRKWTTGPLRQVVAEQPRINDPVPTPWATSTVLVADRGEPKGIGTQNPPAVSANREPQRGDAVRFWTGDRWSIGTVTTICRGTPRKILVSVDRGADKRSKNYRIESDKATIVPRGQA